jgi:hypothetical protein
MPRFFKKPKHVGRKRGTRANLKNSRAKHRHNVFRHKTIRREVTKQQHIYKHLSNITWTLFKIQANFHPVSVDEHDIGNYEYTWTDTPEIAQLISRWASNPDEVLRILNEEFDMYRTKTGKYAASLPLGTIAQEAFKYGNAATNTKYGGSSVSTGARTCSFLAVTVITMISLGRANAEWYSLHVPFEERNIANNIGSISSTIGSVCLGLAYVPGPHASYAQSCVVVTSGIAGLCSTIDMSVRFMDHSSGIHPLTPAQIASVSVSTGLSLLSAVPAITAASQLRLTNRSNPAQYSPTISATALGYGAAAVIPTAAAVGALEGNVMGTAQLMGSNIATRARAPVELYSNLANVVTSNKPIGNKVTGVVTAGMEASNKLYTGPEIRAVGRP